MTNCLRSLNTDKINLSNFQQKVGMCYRSTEVFLFHRSNTHKSSCKFNYLPLSNFKMLR